METSYEQDDGQKLNDTAKQFLHDLSNVISTHGVDRKVGLSSLAIAVGMVQSVELLLATMNTHIAVRQAQRAQGESNVG